MDIELEIPYSNIPHFPLSTVEGHKGKISIGKINNQWILVLKGRFHYYEGYDLKEITFYIRVLKLLGIEKLIITNASGAVNPNIHKGDIVFIEDHINFLGENPLRGINNEKLGLRFPPMKEIYDKKLLKKITTICDKQMIHYHKGVYLGLQGPSLETPAEYRMFRMWGADVVGMSTVAEVIVAAQCELKVVCISVCTNNPFENDGDTIEEVIAAAEKTGKVISEIIYEFVEQI